MNTVYRVVIPKVLRNTAIKLASYEERGYPEHRINSPCFFFSTTETVDAFMNSIGASWIGERGFYYHDRLGIVIPTYEIKLDLEIFVNPNNEFMKPKPPRIAADVLKRFGIPK